MDETNVRAENNQLKIQINATQELLATATAQVQTLSTRNAQLEQENKELKKRKESSVQ